MKTTHGETTVKRCNKILLRKWENLVVRCFAVQQRRQSEGMISENNREWLASFILMTGSRVRGVGEEEGGRRVKGTTGVRFGEQKR